MKGMNLTAVSATKASSVTLYGFGKMEPKRNTVILPVMCFILNITKLTFFYSYTLSYGR